MIFARKLKNTLIYPKMPEFYMIIAGNFFLGGGEGMCPLLHSRFLCLLIVIGLRDIGFPGPAVALDGPGWL